MTKKIIVAIDGFSSCGKSTMAKQLAHDVGYIYIDSGAMYRAVALHCMRQGWITNDDMDVESIESHIHTVQLKFVLNDTGYAEIYLNGENVESAIRSLEVSNGASRVSTLPAVRKELVRQQQQMGVEKGIVMDGRDIGTVVFPDAELKVFLTASPEIRAQRRMDELLQKGEQVSFKDVLANVKERDYRDQNRKVSPLRKAEDAVLIDNSLMTLREQQKVIMELFEQRVAAL
ncbi:MAG TPA: (d)CMP kinase [Paludibacter sp.]|jgi:cytidylate kinase|nr:(d)CMP kinase [Bacteroidales bacterium]HOG05440.1 (d)CMP kinase [Paludibacter sp.]